MSPFITQKVVSMTFFTDCCTWNFFSMEEFVCFHFIDCFFIHGNCDKAVFSPIVKIYLNKTCFFIHITHSSWNNNKPYSNTSPIILYTRHIILPPNPTTTLIEKKLNHLGIKTTTRTTETVLSWSCFEPKGMRLGVVEQSC